MEIKTKRIYDTYSPDDGFRILVDRLWPRGVKKETLKYDSWEKDIAPSNELRRWFHQDKTGNWNEFESRYARELESSDSAKAFIEEIKPHKTITLLYGAKDREHNQVLILKPFLERQLKR